MEAFLAMGIAPAILDQANVASKVNIRGRFTTVTEDFSMIQSRFKGIFLLSQRKTEDILEAQLELYGGHVQRGVELLSFSQQEQQDTDTDTDTDTDHPITARLRNLHTKKEWTVKCKYLIGADGSHSTIRHLLQLPFNGAPYPEDFVLLDAKIKVREGETRLLGPSLLMGSPFMAMFPLDGGLVRLVSKCDESFLPPPPVAGAAVSDDGERTHTHTNGNGEGEGEESANNQNPTNSTTPPTPPTPTTTTTNQTNNNNNTTKQKENEEATVVDAIDNHATEAAILSRFQSMLLERCPEIESLYDVDWASVFRIHRRVVPQYRVGKVFLMGDAAHIHSPVGGQGVCVCVFMCVCMLVFK
jgi:2-polyprenyl-6-methoxyphenol hydroxylase-like FAD-dependent oxidoreductase